MKNTVWFLGAGLIAVGCLFSDLDVADNVPGVGASGEAGEGGTASSETDAMGGKSNHIAGSSNNGGDPGASAGTAGEAQGGEPTSGGTSGMGGGNEGGVGANTSEGGEPSVGGQGGMTNGGSAGSGGVNGGNAGSGGSGGSGGGGTILDVWPSSGCGKAYGGAVATKITIGTTGVKDANCEAHMKNGDKRCGPWGQDASTWQKPPLPRDYWVNLPANYDKSKPYPLVFEGPGCGGSGLNVYALTNIKDQVIRIGLSPANPQIVGHGTNPEQGCFDEKEGDDSLDWVFYETLYDKLNDELCWDRNRVFSVGDSSGSWLSNELVCKYAGDTKRPVRGILANTGGLPSESRWAPACTDAPMAGMWVHETGDTENPFAGAKFAITRAMKVNKCTGSISYDDAVTKGNLADYPIGGGNPNTTCKQILGCPADYPLVVCAIPGTQHAPHNNVVEPGAGVFFTSLMAK
jgi:poly(3-hydroxybutyrate) depolymerase